MDSTEDPVVAEECLAGAPLQVDVYLSLSLSDRLTLLQYPLRPAHTPYDPSSILGAQVNDEGGVALHMGICPKGVNYSASRGEGYAKMVHMGLQDQDADKPYSSGLWDKMTLTCDQALGDPSRYAAAVFKDGDLHLTPVSSIVQLKPSLAYLDQVDTGSKASRVGVVTSDGGDTTESEGEEAIPVTVKFARQAPLGKVKSVERKKTFKERESHDWCDVCYYGIQSEEATEERGLLFANDEDCQMSFDLSCSAYLDHICPVDIPTTTTSPITMPTGVLSLSQLKTLPLQQQVFKVHRNAHVIQFGQLCSLLGETGQSPGVLEAVRKCGVLVQGCWVVKSDIVYPHGVEDKNKRNTRDYILWCFTQKRLVPRKEVVGSVKVSHEELREILQPLSVLKAAPHSGWEFKLPTDVEFINRQSAIVAEQVEWWTQRHKELVKELSVKSPGSVKHHEGKVIPGDQLVKNAQKKSKAKLSEVFTAKKQLELAPHSETQLASDSEDHVVKDGTSKSVTQEETVQLLSEFCRECLGRDVSGIGELRDKLLLKQSSAGEEDPLRMCVVSDGLLLTAIEACGAMQVGQASGKTLFSLTHGDKVRSVILSIFQKQKSVKKKQVTEELTAQGAASTDKIVIGCLRELCYTKGSQWKLLGTD